MEIQRKERIAALASSAVDALDVSPPKIHNLNDDSAYSSGKCEEVFAIAKRFYVFANIIVSTTHSKSVTMIVVHNLTLQKFQSIAGEGKSDDQDKGENSLPPPDQSAAGKPAEKRSESSLSSGETLSETKIEEPVDPNEPKSKPEEQRSKEKPTETKDS